MNLEKLYALMGLGGHPRREAVFDKITTIGVLAGGSAAYACCDFIDVGLNGDVDLFVLSGNSENFMILADLICSYLGEGCTFAVSPSRSILIITSGIVKIQIIMCGHTTVEGLLNGFDLDYVRCGYHKSTVYIRPEAAAAHSSRVINVFSPCIRASRIEKCVSKGFNCEKILPCFMRNDRAIVYEKIDDYRSCVFTEIEEYVQDDLDMNGVSGIGVKLDYDISRCLYVSDGKRVDSGPVKIHPVQITLKFGDEREYVTNNSIIPLPVRVRKMITEKSAWFSADFDLCGLVVGNAQFNPKTDFYPERDDEEEGVDYDREFKLRWGDDDHFPQIREGAHVTLFVKLSVCSVPGIGKLRPYFVITRVVKGLLFQDFAHAVFASGGDGDLARKIAECERIMSSHDRTTASIAHGRSVGGADIPERIWHINWCKMRAYEYLARDDVDGAVGSIMSDLRKHPATSDLAMLAFGMLGRLRTKKGVCDFIDGFS